MPSSPAFTQTGLRPRVSPPRQLNKLLYCQLAKNVALALLKYLAMPVGNHPKTAHALSQKMEDYYATNLKNLCADVCNFHDTNYYLQWGKN